MQHTVYFNLNLPDGPDRVDVEALNENSEIIDVSMAQIRSKAEAPVYYNEVLNAPESLPASDVYPWAKKSAKPSYEAYEVGSLSSTEIYGIKDNLQVQIDELDEKVDEILPLPDEFIDSLFDT